MVESLTERLKTASLYLCTDARRERGDLAEFADAALAGGVDIIQLRDKGSAGEREFGPLEARQELEALAVLADAGLVVLRRQGRYTFIDLDTSPLQQIYQRWRVGPCESDT